MTVQNWSLHQPWCAAVIAENAMLPWRVRCDCKRTPKSAPRDVDSLPSGESDPSVTIDLRGADTTSPVSRKAHKVMTTDEYAVMQIIGWHEVCRDVDGFGGVGVRFLGTAPVTSQQGNTP